MFSDTIMFNFRAGIHAREWISPATVTYVTNEILSPTNEVFKVLARAHNWFIFPNTNPDGYEYTHTTVSFSKV